MNKYLRHKNYQLVVVVFILLACVWGIYLRYESRRPPLWADELQQIKQMNISLAATIEGSSYFSQFPGDHLLIYPFYQWFGENKWGLAIPHIIITLIGFYLLYIMCNSYFETPWAYIITFIIFAANRTLIRHAFEIRPYSVLATLSISSFLIVGYIFRKGKPSRIKQILIEIYIFITILFHSFSAFILFFAYLYHLLVSRGNESVRSALFRHLKQYSVAVLIALPIYWYFAFACYPRLYTHRLDVFEWCGRGVIPILKMIVGNLTGRKIFYLLLPGVVINFFISHNQRFKQMLFLVILIIVPISLIFLMCLHCNYFFIQRLFIWTIPPFIFLVGWSWNSIIIYFTEQMKRKSALL